MKLSVALTLTLITATSAFAPNLRAIESSSTALQMSDMPAQTEIKGYYTNLEGRNSQMDGATLPGSMNFDPLGFSETQGGLFFQREAEIKHARLAMLVRDTKEYDHFV